MMRRRTIKRQPPIKAEKLAQSVRAWSSEQKESLKKALISQLVMKETFDKYAARIEVLKTFATELGYNFYAPATIEDFVIALYQNGYAGSTAEGYKSAWLFNFKYNEIPPISSEKNSAIDNIIGGFKYRGGIVDNGRGTLDSGMLQSLVNFAEGKGLYDYAVGFLICWHGGFRHTALTEICVHDVRFDVKGMPLIFVPKAKGLRAKRQKGELKGHFKRVPECLLLLQALIKGRKGDEKLLTWSQDKARQIIHECASTLGWDPSKVWDGPHTFRLGAACESRTKEDRDAEARRQMFWQAKSSCVHYQRGWKVHVEDDDPQETNIEE